MSQHDFQTINPATYSGSDLAADLNAWVQAVISRHSGATRPSYAVAGTVWYDTVNSQLKMYTGSADKIIAQGNITTFGIQLIEAADAADVRTLLGVDIIDKSLYPTITNDVTDADHDIVFGSGKIADSSGVEIIDLTSPLTKQIDAAWAAGDDQGGLFSGTVAANTAYACHLIVKDSDGSVDCGFDSSETAANIPSGYTAYKRIGWVITDSSANILGFTQTGDYFYFDVQQTDITDFTPGTTANLLDASCPPETLGILHSVLLASSVDVQVLITSTNQTDSVPSTTLNTLRASASNAASVQITNHVDSSRQVRYRSSSNTVSSLVISTVGWIDQRG